MKTRIIATVFLGALLASLSHVVFADDAPAPPSDAEIDALIRQLGSDSWDVREAADARLTAIGEPAREKLTAALNDPDAEIRWRVRRILDALDWKDLQPLFNKLDPAIVSLLKNFSAQEQQAKISLLQRCHSIASKESIQFDLHLLKSETDENVLAVVYSYLSQSSTREVLDALKKAAESNPTPALLRSLMIVASRCGTAEEKIAAYEQCLKLQPDDQQALTALLPAYEQAQRWEDAAALAGRLSQLIPNNVSYLLKMGDCLEKAGKAKEALDAWMQITTKPYRYDNYKSVADRLEKAGYLQEAVELWRAAYKRKDQYADEALVSALLKANQTDAAVAILKEVLRNCADQSRAIYMERRLATILDWDSKPDDAIAYIKSMAAESEKSADPDNMAACWLLMARTADHYKKYPDALAACDRLRQGFPGATVRAQEILTVPANFYYLYGKWDKAEHALEALVASGKEAYGDYTRLALVKHKLGKDDQSKDALRRMLQKAADQKLDYTEILNYIKYLAWDQSDNFVLGSAASLMLETGAYKASLDSLLAMADLLGKCGKWAEAADCLRQSVLACATDSYVARIRTTLLDLETGLSSREAVLKNYRALAAQSLKDGKTADALRYYILVDGIAFRLGDYKARIEACKNFVDLGPSVANEFAISHDYRDDLVRLYLTTSQWDQAIALGEPLLKELSDTERPRATRSAAIYSCLIRAYMQKGDIEHAEQLISDVSGDDYVLRAMLLYNLGQKEKSAALLVEAAPDDTKALQYAYANFRGNDSGAKAHEFLIEMRNKADSLERVQAVNAILAGEIMAAGKPLEDAALIKARVEKSISEKNYAEAAKDAYLLKLLASIARLTKEEAWATVRLSELESDSPFSEKIDPHDVAYAHIELGEWQKAADMLTALLQTVPVDTYPSAYVRLGECYFQLGDKDKAMQTWLSVVHAPDFNPPPREEDAFAYFLRALAKHGMTAEALKTLGGKERQLIKNPGALQNFGLALLQAGEIQQSIWYLVEAVRTQPGNGPEWGYAKVIREILTNAFVDADTARVTAAIEADANKNTAALAPILLTRAETLEKGGATDAAISAYKKIIALAPASDSAAKARDALKRLEPPASAGG
jgi:pentatricopeptide repeat protein